MTDQAAGSLYGRVILVDPLPWQPRALTHKPAAALDDPGAEHSFIAGDAVTVVEAGHTVAIADSSWLREASIELSTAPGQPSRGAKAAVDCENGTVTLSTDRLGSCPIYYHSDGRVLSFSTDLKWLCKEAGSPPVSSQAIFDYVHFHVIPAPSCIFAGIERLRPGSTLTCTGTGHCETRYWWLPDFHRSETVDLQALQKDLRSCLRESVRLQAPPESKVGAFLSGGLDSSTVAGYLAEVSAAPTHAYAMGFDAEGYDEMPFARITAEHFGIELHEYYVTPDDVVQALPALAAAFDQPFGNSSALPAYFCAKFAAADGIELLLAGDGGDELFAGNERYLQHTPFERYRQLPAALQAAVRFGTKFIPGSSGLGRRARSFLKQAAMPLPQRLYYYSFLNQFDPAHVFSDKVLSAVNVTSADESVSGVFNAPDAGDQLDRMLFHDWQYTLADNDLRKVSQTCSLAGVQVAYPMLSDELMDLASRVPSEIKTEHGELRRFYKEALRGWLPDATLAKSKHGFGLPFGVWMREHVPLRELAYDAISALASRDLFRKSFLDEAVSQHRAGHAAYYGELVWMLTTLELWIAARE